MKAGRADLTKADPAQAERLHRFAHDLKNRLGGLAASLRMLAELGPGPERDEVTDYAEKAYFRALYELEDVLDDLGVDRMPRATLQPVDLRALVHRVADELGFRFERKGQQLVVELADGFSVNADPDLLHQAVSALLSNASKFIPAGATVQVRAIDRGITVTDPGVGLSAEDLPQVFRAYAMLSSRSTAGEEQGRGSLARAQRAMRAQGGTLEVSSAGPGRGCTFTLRLPA